MVNLPFLSNTSTSSSSSSSWTSLNRNKKWSFWFRLMYISVSIVGFGLFCLICGYWMAFIKYAQITSSRAIMVPYELYFIISGALFAIIGGFMYSRATKTIDNFNEQQLPIVHNGQSSLHNNRTSTSSTSPIIRPNNYPTQHSMSRIIDNNNFNQPEPQFNNNNQRQFWWKHHQQNGMVGAGQIITINNNNNGQDQQQHIITPSTINNQI